MGTKLDNNFGRQVSVSADTSMGMSVEEKWGVIGSLAFYLHDTEPLEPFYFAGKSFSRAELLARMISFRETFRQAGQPGVYSFRQSQEQVLEALFNWLVSSVSSTSSPASHATPK